MEAKDIALRRLTRQHIARPHLKDSADVVKWLGAVQAQDYPGSVWAIGLRTKDGTETAVERAVANKRIVRTWPMRGTLHFVSPDDVRWMLKYLTPRIVARAAFRFRQLELDEAAFSQSRRILAKALVGHNRLTRDGVYTLLERNRISCKGQRGIHILWRLAQEGLICFGPRDGKQHTFVLLEEWIPASKTIAREEALADFAKRYFVSHGPATIEDFSWWTGLTKVEARSSLEDVKSRLVSDTFRGKTFWFSNDAGSRARFSSAAFLLPPFDEFLTGYTDRTAIVLRRNAKRMDPGGGILYATVVVDGQVIGTWNRSVQKDSVELQVRPFKRMGKSQRIAVEKAALSYGRFLRKSVKFDVEQ